MKELCSEIDVKAPAERVWKVLTDFADYPQWNPFIRWVTGEAKPGSRLKINVQPSGARGYVLRPRVITVETNRVLRWVGNAVIPGLFEGEHSFIIEPITSGKVRFIQKEKYKGLLIPLLSHTLDKDIKRGFDEMNKALKKRAEQGH